MSSSTNATKIDLKDQKEVERSLKVDLKNSEKKLGKKITDTRIELKIDINNLETKLREFKTETKNEFQSLNNKLDNLQNTLDGFVSTVDDLRTENTVGVHHTAELQVEVQDHEDRIKTLESSLKD